MRKKLLTILFPVVIAIACSIAVWANEPSVAPPACDKCPKADKIAPAKDVKAAQGCDKCSKMKEAALGCDKCAKDVKDVKAAQGCDKCAKMKEAAGKPCGEKGCDKGAMDAAKCAKLKAEGKPCGEMGCDKRSKDAAATQGCEKCAKMKKAEVMPCAEKGCDKSAKAPQVEKKPCCDKGKPE